MALQAGALRDALLAANVPPDLAGKASEEAAGYDSRLNKIDRQLAAIQGTLGVLTTLVGVSITLSVLLIGGMFVMWSKIGDLASQIARIAPH